MNSNRFIKVLALVVCLALLCGMGVPVPAAAASEKKEHRGMQQFFEKEGNARLLIRAGVAYMEYAKLLRTDTGTKALMGMLCYLYDMDAEPTKAQYKQALAHVIKTYEQENAAQMTQQNRMDTPKGLEDYINDVVGMGVGHMAAAGWLKESASLALSVMDETANSGEEWLKGVSVLKTTLQNYENYENFLALIETKSGGALKEAAKELRQEIADVMQVRLRSYGELAYSTAENYAKLFIDEIFSEDWFDYIQKKMNYPSSLLSLFEGWTAMQLGVEFGTFAGNLLINAEDVLNYLIEIKAVYDISVILEQEVGRIGNNFTADGLKITEEDAQSYVRFGNYLISSRIRGQYCMTAIYVQCDSLRMWYDEQTVNSVQKLYDDLTSYLMSIKADLDLISGRAGMSLVLGGVQADSIQYYKCPESGNFAVIERNGKYGIIGYDGELIQPIEFDRICQGSGYGYEYLLAVRDLDDYSEPMYCIGKDGELEEGYPDGGDLKPETYWYNGEAVILVPGDEIIGGWETLEEWGDYIETYVSQRPWIKGAVLPVRQMSGVKEQLWGTMPQVTNTNYALLNTVTGELITDFVYSAFDEYNCFSEGLLAIKKGNKWGFVDKSGNEVIPFLYDAYAESAYYDEDMEILVEFYSIYTATNGYITVLRDGKWGLIDKQGNVILENAYEGISQVNPDGMFWLKENGLWNLYQLQ